MSDKTSDNHEFILELYSEVRSDTLELSVTGTLNTVYWFIKKELVNSDSDECRIYVEIEDTNSGVERKFIENIDLRQLTRIMSAKSPYLN